MGDRAGGLLGWSLRLVPGVWGLQVVHMTEQRRESGVKLPRDPSPFV